MLILLNSMTALKALWILYYYDQLELFIAYTSIMAILLGHLYRIEVYRGGLTV